MDTSCHAQWFISLPPGIIANRLGYGNLTGSNSMSYDYVIDGYAWVEYFAGSDKGKSAIKYIRESASATTTVVIAELSRKLLNEDP